MAGEAKTRLAPALGAEGAARLAEALLRDTWRILEEDADITPILATTGAGAALLPALLRPAGPPPPILLQGEGPFGERLERVLRALLAGGGPALVIGADAPGLRAEAIHAAAARLEAAEAVLCPAEDGGYWLIGLRVCPPGLLDGIPWSQPGTLAATAARLRELGLRVALGEPGWDVDEPADLERLRALVTDGHLSLPATAAALGLRPADAAPPPPPGDAGRPGRAR